MLPESSTYLDTFTESNFVVQSSLTYKLDLVNKRISGKVDDRAAVFQAVKKILATNRYAMEIYSGNYGEELFALVGKPYAYIQTEAPRIIKEALSQDDRILGVTNFVMNRISVDSMELSFKVNTIYGDILYTTEVAI